MLNRPVLNRSVLNRPVLDRPVLDRPVPNRPLWRLVRQVGNVVVATCAALAALALCTAGFREVPALGRVLDPGHGAWTSATGGQLPASQTLRLPGITGGATVTFDRHGIATIDAASEADAIVALGYTQASLRLAQMDLERRLAEGTLAALVGPSAVASDEFELRLGLLRTAQREWAEMPKNGVASQLLTDYSIGVNDYLARVRQTKRWPALFSLAGVYPADWTPLDSLAVQGELAQELDYTTTPLDYALLARSLGVARTMRWFPVLPVSKQNPYDPGPYHSSGVAPIATTMTTAAAVRGIGRMRGTVADRPAPVSTALARAAAAIVSVTSALPAGQIRAYPDSNAWAANGPKVSGGGSMLAGDPHLPPKLPSAWFEVALSAPGYDVAGVSLPGLPGVLVGHNRQIAWSLTDTQNQATLFYEEKTSKAHPGQYFWHGAWRAMRHVRYTIDVRGSAPRQITVEETAHGPVMTQVGQTVSVDWMGNVTSPDVAVIQQISTARDFGQFRAALASWRAPAQTFLYADDRGNIGAISAGYFPIVRHGAPWFPMTGTGVDDVAGVIPYSAVPQSYDPPSHVIAAANQRPVTAAYPYYIGTTARLFDPGYRASREYGFLTRRNNLGVSGFAALQMSQTDELAAQVLPRMLALLTGADLRPIQRQAVTLLRGWNYSMDQNSAAAAIWWNLWSDYLYATFEPWWRTARVPIGLDRSALAVSVSQFSLVQLLEQWTLTDPANPVFSPPGRPAGTARSVLRAALATAVDQLRSQLRAGPSTWAWGRLHSTRFPSLTNAPGLGYGPIAAGGDPWTVNAADGTPVATPGPSWRMIVRWPDSSGRGDAVAWGVYPGGQSENPASPWYENLIADWQSGTYLPMPQPGAPASGPGIRWEFER